MIWHAPTETQRALVVLFLLNTKIQFQSVEYKDYMHKKKIVMSHFLWVLKKPPKTQNRVGARSLLEHGANGANNTNIVCSILVWAIYLKAGLYDPCGSLPT